MCLAQSLWMAEEYVSQQMVKLHKLITVIFIVVTQIFLLGWGVAEYHRA